MSKENEHEIIDQLISIKYGVYSVAAIGVAILLILIMILIESIL
jgi:uncharacterized membrane protein YukC